MCQSVLVSAVLRLAQIIVWGSANNKSVEQSSEVCGKKGKGASVSMCR